MYIINSINIQKPNVIVIYIENTGASSYMQTRRMGIKFLDCNIIDWADLGGSSENHFVENNGIWQLTVTGFDFYFTGDTYDIYIEIFNTNTSQINQPYIRGTLPLQANIANSYQIPEKPTQQSQNVYYNSTYIGETNSCVANAVASAKEIQSIRKNKHVQPSVGWFWGRTGSSESGGTNYKRAFEFLKNNGIPPYQVVSKKNSVFGYPDIYFYSDAKNIGDITGDVSQYALPQKIERYDILNPYAGQLQIICDTIQNPKYCVILTINTDNSIKSSVAETTGIVPSISGSTGDGHAMIVLGWQTINNRKYWVCQNSWCYPNGNPKGQFGYYFIPFNWGNAVIGSGISRFYALKDDDNAPILPTLPPVTNIDAILVKRYTNGLEFKCTTIKSATEYRLHFVNKDTSEEFYLYSNDCEEPLFIFAVEEVYEYGVRYGYTYLVDASARINGVWSRSNSYVQITLLPKYSWIESATSTSNSSIAVKMEKPDSDVGKFTKIRVFRGRENFTEQSPFPFEEYVDISSYNDLAVFNNLTTGSTWSFTSRTYLEVKNQDSIVEVLWSGFYSQEVLATVGESKPFKWTYPKIKNELFNLTADEWNAFTTKINAVRASKALPAYSFKLAIKGEIFSAELYNSARQAIQAIHGYGTYIPTVKKDDIVTADAMNIIVNELNLVK